MEKKLRRLAILLATVVMLVSVLVTGAFATQAEDSTPVCYLHGDVNGDGLLTHRDAFYLLYHTFDDEEYPLTQEGDFNSDAKITHRDAFYLLYASFEDEDYPMKGKVHGYYAPVWDWGDEVSVTLKCGGGYLHTYTSGDEGDVTVTEIERVEATCVAAGYVVKEAKVEVDGKEYTNQKTIILPAGTGHEMEGTQSCTSGSKCKNCDYTLPALDHSWKLNDVLSTAATCEKNAVNVYSCICGQTKEETVNGTLAHTYAYIGDVAGAEDCQFVKQYKCTSCEKVINGTAASDSYYKHDYAVELTKEANCSEAGEKTYTCKVCSDAYTEAVAKNDSHAWDGGVNNAGIITYTCDDCGNTKTTVSAANNQAVDKSVLDTVKELKLDKGAAIEMDDATKAGLAEDAQIKISVTSVNVDSTALSDAEKAQVGDNVVYNFEMTANGTPVTNFEGEVTVSLPYTLADGEDIDSIDVWFIDNEGKLTQMKGTYSNGFVTFTTTHFSYYTVTRLTPAERCARYGHIQVDSSKKATCTEDGYDMSVCQRCGKELAETVYKMSGHAYEDTDKAVEVTCEQNGKLDQKCKNCGDTITGEIPALGHNMLETEIVPASCVTTGKHIFTCQNVDCMHTSEEEIPQTGHLIEVIESKDADCTNNGYIRSHCGACGLEELSGETPALGHKFLTDDATWAWSDEYDSATVTLVCEHDASHVKVLNAVITEKSVSASCVAAGSTTYTATVSFNNVTYTDTKAETIGTASHKPATEWSSNKTSHYHVCSVCGTPVDTANHTWGEQVVVKAPTCVASGLAKVSCTICGYENEKVLGATGEHSFVDGVCSVCGYVDGSCDHIRINRTEVDAQICGDGKIWNVSCDCGQTSYVDYDLWCDFAEETYEDIILEDGTEAILISRNCRECGLTLEYSDYEKADEANCIGHWYWYACLSMDDKVLAEGTYQYSSYDHPETKEPHEIVNLADYGLCESKIDLYYCYCGETHYANEVEMGCRWVKDEAGSDDDTTKYVCSNCDGVLIVEYTKSGNPANCESRESWTNIYYDANGNEVYTFTNVSVWKNHAYSVSAYELDGETCEDGLMLTWTCEDCGDTFKRYTFGHALVLETVTDLSNEDICADALIQSVCPCPEQRMMYNMVYPDDTWCDWIYGWADDTAKCAECGATKKTTETRGDKDEDCRVRFTVTHTFADKNGKTIATGIDNYFETEHDYNVTAELVTPGTKCTAGVDLTYTCKDCGDIFEERINGHYGLVKETYDLSALGMCTKQARIQECICGEESWLSTWDNGKNCNWDWLDSNIRNGWQEYCVDCGAVMTVETVDLAKPDACHTNRDYTYTFSMEGKTDVVIEFNKTDITHGNETFKQELLPGAEDCYDGYTVTMYCSTCGAEEDWGEQYHHEERPVKSEVLYDGDELCGKLYFVTNACACGEYNWSGTNWRDGYCQYNGGYDDQKTGEFVQVCVNCGSERRSKWDQQPVEGEPCKVQETQQLRFFNQQGEELCSYENTDIYDNHANVYTYALQGETCDSGYTMSAVCARCGEQSTFEGIRYGCNSRLVEFAQIHDGTGICGPVEWRRDACACGQYGDAWVDNECNWSWVGWNKDGVTETYKCPDCGLEMSGYESETRVPNSCTVNTTIDWTYTLNGEEIGRIQKTYSNVSHQTVASFQMLGDTCEDGYYVTESCKYCNYSETYDNLRYNHGWYTVDRYDLTDYGMCGGELWLESCACGLVSSMGWNGWNCNASNVGVDAETGLPIRKCSDCGLSFVRGEDGNVNTNCRYTGTAYFKIFDANDDLILDLEHAVSNESHEDKVLNLILDNPDGTCNEGWTAEFACVNCGRTDEERGYYHRTWTLDYLDLSEYNTCGGYVSTYGCACGQDEYYNWDLECNLRHIDGGYATDADGKEYYYDNYKCALCGLQRNDVRYEEYEGDSCYGISTRRNTFILGTELNKTIERVNETERHEYEYTYSLLPGSVTCEDGIQVNAICKKCGYVTGHTSDYHGENLVESMDLTEFGSICGGALNHYSCPCGAEQRYDISEDTECDVYRNGIAHWIPNVLDTYQHTTEGYMGTWSYSYLLNCAVTDPEQCGLRIRMAEYWLKEGCEAVEYQTWQLGYDDQTDTCKREITIPTGERHAFHAYIRTNYNDVVQADGTVMWGWRDDCPDCGSYYEDLYYDNQNGARILNVENAVNTLNNGENRERHMRYEFGFEYSGHRYMTLERYEYIRSDGSTYWNQHAYAYDFSDGCRCTRTYTNSQGNYEVYQQDAHVGGWHGEWLQDRSCTQFGLYHEWEECSVCGATFDEYYEDYVPYDHDWYWDYSKETYVCNRCGLENSNAASGSIIMEDLTGIHNGDQYVIGYWNRGQVEFIPNISIVLEDATGDDDLLTLSYSDFWYWNAETDVATAVACDKAAVDAAVEAAMIEAGYTGNYAIRISFVPINGDTTLDYAITFDSQYFANALAA